jgi:hypothetical protein
VATDEGLRLDEYLNPLLERPPLNEVLGAPGVGCVAEKMSR